MSGAPVKMVNVAAAVEGQRIADAGTDTEGCPHCEPGRVVSGEHPVQTRSCMQREAVKATVSRLRAHEQVDEENIPRGEARGRIILPCGTGKTRIALRITEQLTYPGELSVVLCPSIALVAQIRREFLQHTTVPMRMLAVCSDKGVAANDEKVANSKDDTIDRGLATTEDIQGLSGHHRPRTDSRLDKPTAARSSCGRGECDLRDLPVRAARVRRHQAGGRC